MIALHCSSNAPRHVHHHTTKSFCATITSATLILDILLRKEIRAHFHLQPRPVVPVGIGAKPSNRKLRCSGATPPYNATQRKHKSFGDIVACCHLNHSKNMPKHHHPYVRKTGNANSSDGFLSKLLPANHAAAPRPISDNKTTIAYAPISTAM